VLVVASLFLGAVFLLSGIMKVASPDLWRNQSADLGVPRVPAQFVPFVELAIGALLAAQIARQAVAIVAGVMLLAFTALLVLRISQGRRPPCACFGTWSTKPIGWTDVVRNVALLAVAVLIGVTAG
jgi:uncharacterized membrane protein YphA (DoxX/SURF4 family)